MIVTVTGVAETIQALSQLLDIAGLLPAFEAGGDVFLKYARIEPAERPNQRYVRTHDLRDAWDRQSTTEPEAIAIDILNPTSYGPWVYGDSDQAWMHVGRWPTESELIAEAEGPIVVTIEQGIDDWIARVGVL